MAKIILLLDEDVRPMLGEILRQRGYDAVHVLDAGRTFSAGTAKRFIAPSSSVFGAPHRR